jgi:hypothetical protein
MTVTLTLMDELIDAYLFNSYELRSVLNSETAQITLDGDEGITGEPEIDWDDEVETEHLLIIPQITSDEAFRVMVDFTYEQTDEVSQQLLEMLNRRKPFRNFKDKIIDLEIEEDWYRFERDYAIKEIHDWLDSNDLSLDLLEQKYKRL